MISYTCQEQITLTNSNSGLNKLLLQESTMKELGKTTGKLSRVVKPYIFHVCCFYVAVPTAYSSSQARD